MGVTWSQFFPPTPTLTEANLASFAGKVCIVTGGTAGVGYELCSILYGKGAKVYIAARSESKAKAAIAKIKAAHPSSAGELVFLHIALDDLTTIKPAVDTFKAAESRLDTLFLNAGVSNPPVGSVGAQGHELQMATNCLGHYLFTQLLIPILVSTAKTTTPGSTRVIWTSSIATDLGAPKGGIVLEHVISPPAAPQYNYTTSKTGNWFLADSLAKQIGDQGVLSLTLNPGNLKSELTRHFNSLVPIIVSPLLHPPVYGAYTNLWAGFSKDLSLADGGKYVLPWGRLHPAPREDILLAFKSEAEGGTGIAQAFVDFCAKQTERFAGAESTVCSRRTFRPIPDLACLVPPFYFVTSFFFSEEARESES